MTNYNKIQKKEQLFNIKPEATSAPDGLLFGFERDGCQFSILFNHCPLIATEGCTVSSSKNAEETTL